MAFKRVRVKTHPEKRNLSNPRSPPNLKLKRQKEAKERQAAYNKLTDAQKLAKSEKWKEVHTDDTVPAVTRLSGL